MTSLVIVFVRHWKLYTTLLGIGVLPAIFGNGTFLIAALIIVGASILALISQGRGKKVKFDKPLETYTKNELVAGLQYANVKLNENEKEIARLARQVNELASVDKDSGLRDEVLRAVATTLVEFDRRENVVSAEQALFLLRLQLSKLIG